ncbi:MAG: hypothetical protein ACI8S6_004318, partial [Myxococcota bacterium]
MFWHQTPLFTGIDLDNGYLFSTEKVQRCSGPEWVSRLQTLNVNGFDPTVIIKDAGLAMTAAVTEVLPDADQGDDAEAVRSRQQYAPNVRRGSDPAPRSGRTDRRAWRASSEAGCAVSDQPWQREERQAELEESTRELIALSGTPARLARVFEVIVPVLVRRRRASSAIENLHSIVRPHITVHKRVS